MNTLLTPTMIALAVMAVIILVLIFWIVRLERKLRTLLATKSADRIDHTLEALYRNIEQLNAFQTNADRHLKNLEQRMQRTIRGVDTVRFNPFYGDGSGGNHSFATALMTERGDGIVLSSLYTRERTNIFSKPIATFEPHQELSEEEEEVMKRAHQKTHQ